MYKINAIENVEGKICIYKKVNNALIKLNETKNVILNAFKNCACGTYDGSGYSNNTFLEVTGIAIGTGTGVPSASDTALFSKSFEIRGQTTKSKVLNERVVTYTYSFSVPADSSHVGTFTEYGLLCYMSGNYYTCTHGLFKDAEGNPISITKTDLDEWIVSYVVTITYPDELMACLWRSDSNGVRYYSGPAAYIAETMPMYHEDDTYYYLNCKSPNAIKNYLQVTPRYQFAEGRADISIDRIAANKYNDRFIFALMLIRYSYSAYNGTTFALVELHKHMQIAELTDYIVGVGDDSTTAFNAPLPAWLKDTEKLYINGVLQTRGVDYTCGNCAPTINCKSIRPSSHGIVISGLLSSNTPSGTYYISSITISSSDAGYANTLPSQAISKSVIGNTMDIYLTPSNPIIIKVPRSADLMGIKVNEIYLATSYHDSSVNSSKYDEVTVEVSNDLQTWQTLLENVTGCPASVPIEYSPVNKATSQWAKYTLEDEVDYQYWRISMRMAGGNYDAHNRFGFMLANSGQSIIFTSAPAQDAEIKMDCSISIPWKDDKHVLDLSATFEW